MKLKRGEEERGNEGARGWLAGQVEAVCALII